jgi:hypothetical protein
MYFDDEEEKTTTSNGFLTWYDSRANQPHRSAEYRLYFNDNTAIELAKPGDLLLIGKRPDGSTLALIVKRIRPLKGRTFGFSKSKKTMTGLL